MSYVLRPYQEKSKELIKEKFKQGIKKIILWAQTGAGKGLIMADIAHDSYIRGNKILVVMRRRDLIFQTHANFLRYLKINCSIIMGNHKKLMDKNHPIQITSIDTLSRRIGKSEYEFLKTYNLIMVDEAHDTTSSSYTDFFNFIGDRFYVGYTATPFSIGKKPLSFWEDYVKPIEAHELRDQGYLVPARIYAPKEQINTRGIKRTGGDFNQKQLSSIAQDGVIVGDIIEHYKKFGDFRPTVLFAVNIEHSKLLCEAFNKAGISASHCDQSDCKNIREKAIQELKNEKIKILCNVNIFSTGIDIPEASVAILARPTLSKILFLQQVGRVLRTHLGKKDAVIIDHAGNTLRHGSPYMIREAEIGGQKKEIIKKIKMFVCPRCYYVMDYFQSPCQGCGATNEEKKERTINQVDGSLELINDNNPHIVNEKKFAGFGKIKNTLSQLIYLEKSLKWKPNAKYFKLHGAYGDEIFYYSKELGLPKWLQKVTMKNIKTS